MITVHFLHNSQCPKRQQILLGVILHLDIQKKLFDLNPFFTDSGAAMAYATLGKTKQASINTEYMWVHFVE